MDIGINSMSSVFSVGADDETVVGMNVASFVDSMVAGAQTPGGIPPLVPVAVGIVLVLEVGAWREGEVHEMGDGGLAAATVEGSHGVGLSHGIVVCEAGSPLSFMLFTQGLLVACLRGLTRRGARTKAARTIASFGGRLDVDWAGRLVVVGSRDV